MDQLRIAVCEDEMDSRENILKILSESPYPAEITTFSCGEEFLAAFRPFQYDLILMDIFMESLTGIQVITQIRELDSEVSVAFITSSKEFTLESYRLDAIAYIEKPATKKKVEATLKLAQLRQQTVDKMVFHIGNTTTSYPLSRILYLEQKGRLLVLYLADGEIVSLNKKLTDAEEQVMGKGFLRCHKSYLVNLAHVRGINRDLSTFEMSEGSHVYIRKRSFWEMQKAFEAYLFAADTGGSHA